MAGTIGFTAINDDNFDELLFNTRKWRGMSQHNDLLPTFRDANRPDNPTSADLAVERKLQQRIKAIDLSADKHYLWHDLVTGDTDQPKDDGSVLE